MYSKPLFSNTRDLFSKIFRVFNEMEMEINVINNEIFTTLYLEIKVLRIYKPIRHYFIMPRK